MPATFHACTLQYNGRADRVITPVCIFAAFDPDKGEKPGPNVESTGLWDTGATRSVITAATANSLGLIPVGITKVNHAGGTSDSNSYIVNFGLPNGVGAKGVLVSECKDIAGAFGAIIGMDIISKGDFAITNEGGTTCMSFRTPSVKKIDYVEEANKLKFAGVCRNDPCPCGAKDEKGKPVKFKRCHGK